ncbi:hypothetical protein PR048_020424 [Dryococelus australis]|uniref:DDE-1 domain-containing protein n=1 Tax=Dryococelus australis TaxID=614101 RepID=A0ABQ9H6G8_9NEOP|nr:hypothetical protein PR048_020424 [Dryococelus australis]
MWSTVLLLDVEKKIVACLITMKQHGFGLSRKDILSLVGEYVGTNVVGGRGLPSTRTTSAPGRDNISVLLTVGASGEKLPPLVIFKGKSVWDDWQPTKEEVFLGTSYVTTENGWMETEVNWPHLQAGSSNEWSMVCESAVVQVGSSIEGSVVHESEVVQAGSSYEGSVICSEVVSQCDPNPPVEISESTSTPVQTPESSVVGPHLSVSRARAGTFEELVLETIENHQSAEKKKKTRLAKEAEVITSDYVYARIRDQDKKKAEAQKRKLENKTNSKKTMKRKREEIKTNTLPAQKARKHNFSLRKTDNEDENWEYYVERMKDQQEEDLQEEDEKPSVVNTDTTNIRAGDWALYGDPVVKYARKALTKENTAAFKFPDRDKISSIDIIDIRRVLSFPKIGSRGEAVFSIHLTTFNAE